MPDVIAQHKFSCPACGAEAHWNPGKQALICPFCGTTSPAHTELSATGEEVIREHDLAAALRAIPDSARGWQAQKTAVKCQSCQAISVFDPERVGQRCDFCGSASLVPYEEIKAVLRPESLLPMKVSESHVREAIRQWYGSRWFAPNKLKRAALTDTVKGLYIPYWTFDAQVHAEWTAQSGYYYYVSESVRGADGKLTTRQVRKVRWTPSAGAVDHFFNDELVCASRGIHADLLARVEPFPTNDLAPYRAGYLSGWVVERYQLDLVAAAQHAQTTMTQKITALCTRAVPGDTHRNLHVAADFSGQTFKHILVPVWLLSYHYGPREYQVVINGYSGKIAGQYPKSWAKILLAVVAALATIALLVRFLGS